jgi:hypothetical protein
MESGEPAMTDQFDTDPLEAVRATQLAVADRVSRGGRGYDIIYSLLVATLVAAPGAGVFWGIAVELLVIIGLVVLIVTWVKKHGMWLSSLKPRKARWVAIGIGLVMSLGYVASFSATRVLGLPGWTVLVPAGMTFVAAMFSSRLWRRIYRREMGLDA